MQITRWYRLLVIGMLALPISSRAQGPQPKVKEIATIPGMDLPAFYGDAVRMPRRQSAVVGTRRCAWMSMAPTYWWQ